MSGHQDPGGVSQLMDQPAGLPALLPPPTADRCITSTRRRGSSGWGVAPHRRPIAASLTGPPPAGGRESDGRTAKKQLTASANLS